MNERDEKMNAQQQEDLRTKTIELPVEELRALREAEARNQHKSRFAAWMTGVGVALFLAAGITLALRHGTSVQPAQHADAEAALTRTVNVLTPKSAPVSSQILLPAGTQAMEDTTIYARANGFVSKIYADIGDNVKAGQVLADIEAPDIDQQLIEARANLHEANANRELSRVTLERYRAAKERGAVSSNEWDEQQALFNTRDAAAKTAEATVKRLEATQGWLKVVAPFDGVIAARNIDRGSLVSSGSQTNVTALFRIVQANVLRVFVDLPQTTVPGIKTGQEVDVTLREYPGQTFKGKVARLNGSLDSASRTRRAEIHLPSENGKLLPGMYVTVALNVAAEKPALIIPAAAVVFDQQGTRVVSVGSDNKIAYKKIFIGRDFGKDLEIIQGIDLADHLVMNPRNDLREGETVIVSKPEQKIAMP